MSSDTVSPGGRPATIADALSSQASNLPFDDRLRLAVDAVRRISMSDDTNSMVRDFEARTRWQMASDRWLAVSRRGLNAGWYRITRNTEWTNPPDPWLEPHRLPVHQGGLLAELVYSDTPSVINNLAERLSPEDPAWPYLSTAGSMMVIHHFDQGEGLNMAVMLKAEPEAFTAEILPEQILVHNLFGRVVKVQLLKDQLRRANEELDRELQVVGQLQRSLLPARLPAIPGLELAASYETARRAGGDYYDVFPLRDGRWGLLIADVSGHGTPAAVLMSVMHAIAHGFPGPHEPAGGLLEYVNERLVNVYTNNTGNFVTAFYAVFDPGTRTLTYANAGHPPPRILRRCGTSPDRGQDEPGAADSPTSRTIGGLNGPAGPPLGVIAGLSYQHATTTLGADDVLVLYTDGITEMMNSTRDLYGTDRLDWVIAERSADCTARHLIEAILASVVDHGQGQPLADDQTLLVLRGLPEAIHR